MGQKVHPIGFRLGISRQHRSIWYADRKDYKVFLASDIAIRTYLDKRLAEASVGDVVIRRSTDLVNVQIYSSRPGLIIGKNAAGVAKLSEELRAVAGGMVQVEVKEISKPDLNARIVADSIASQLRHRAQYRRVMRRALQQVMRAGAEGVRVEMAGRLRGAEIARREWLREGRVPLHTLRADIDYAQVKVVMTYGVLGVKVWIARGEAPPISVEAAE